MQKKSFDIIVVGAGIVGLAAALALALEGFEVAIIEAQNNPKQDLPLATSEYDTKVVAITRASQNFLDYLGLWQTIDLTRSCAYQHMKVWDSVMDGLIEFSAVDFFEDDLGHIIEQSVIQGALWQALKSQPKITIFTGTKIDNFNYQQDKVALNCGEKSTLTAKCLVAADGAASRLRDLCQIATTAWDYKQSAIVATVQGTLTHCLTAYQRFAPDGPLALLPLSHSHLSSIVWTTTPQKSQDLMQLSPGEFAKRLSHEIDGVMGEMSLISERFLFPLKTHHAKQYAVPGCVLVGDAAHTLHPLAGQGVNLGLMDVAALVETLRMNKTRIGEFNILKRYERQRKGHNQIMIWAMELFKQGFSSQDLFVQRVRNFGLNWVNGKPQLKHLFAKMALGTLMNERTLHVKKDVII